MIDSAVGASQPPASFHKLSVIVPCYNEAGNVARFEEELFGALDATPFEKEFLLVDDGSTDGTAAALKKLAERREAVRVLTHTTNRGLGRALRTGIDAATGDAILTLDADLTFHPAAFRMLLEAYQPDIACVAGSPALGGFIGVAWHRRVLSNGVNAIYRKLLGEPLTAVSSIFRLYRAEDLKALTLTSRSFDINAEIAARLLRAKKRIIEVPVTLSQRLHGASKIRFTREIWNHARIFLMIATAR